MGATEIRTPHPTIGPRDTVAGPAAFALVNVNTNPLANGTLVMVTSTGTLYRLDKTSVAVPNGTTVVAPAAGPGRWLAQAGPVAGGSAVGARINNISSPTSIPGTDVATPVTFNAVDFDGDSMADLPSDRLVVNTAGRYLLGANYGFAAPFFGVPFVALGINAALVAADEGIQSGTAGPILAVLAVSDLITVEASQGTGADPATTVTVALWAQLVGPP